VHAALILVNAFPALPAAAVITAQPPLCQTTRDTQDNAGKDNAPNILSNSCLPHCTSAARPAYSRQHAQTTAVMHNPAHPVRTCACRPHSGRWRCGCCAECSSDTVTTRDITVFDVAGSQRVCLPQIPPGHCCGSVWQAPQTKKDMNSGSIVSQNADSGMQIASCQSVDAVLCADNAKRV
jgi:hypothetical protein